jgi:broad specificity phosphatase PhoE
VLLRHGQTIWNAERRFQGQTDIPLDETGTAQAERVARLLAALRPDVIVSSDLGRAVSTAQPLAKFTGLVVSLDKDLRERSGGLWEGLTDEEIRERYPRERETWNPPEGEAAEAVADRVAAALQRVAGTVPPGGLGVVVGHGGSLRLGMERVLGISGQALGVLGPLSNCSWSVLGQHGGRPVGMSNSPQEVQSVAGQEAKPADGGPTRWRLLEHNAGTLPEPVLGDDRLSRGVQTNLPDPPISPGGPRVGRRQAP